MSETRDAVNAATSLAHLIDTMHKQFVETPKALRWCANLILEMEQLLTEAQPSVCYEQCPREWPDDEDRPHCDLCKKITEMLK